MKAFEYAAPRTEAEALGLLSPELGKTEILAGGTDLVGLLKKLVVTPERVVNVIRSEALIQGKRELDTDFFNFRFGPYWEVPVHRRVDLGLSGGLALAVVDSDFKYRESVFIDGVGTQRRSGSDGAQWSKLT